MRRDPDHLLVRLGAADGANHVYEKPETDNRRQRGRQRGQTAIGDQISAVERRLLLDPVHRSLARSSPSALHLPDRPDLDRAVLRAGAARCPRDRGVEIGRVDEEIAPELLLDFGVWAVEDLGLAVLDPD